MSYTVTQPPNSTTISVSPSLSVTGAVGGSGYITTAGSSYITGGSSNGINWQDLGSITYDSSINPNTLHVRGDAEFQGDVKVQGVSIKETLDRINERLAILKPNPELESRWEELRELRQQYQKLEAEILEKEEIVRILSR